MKLKNIQNKIYSIINLEGSPFSIALGAAAGIFWNFIPSLGIGFLLSLLAAKLLKVSSVAAVTMNLATGFFIPVFYSLNVLTGDLLSGITLKTNEVKNQLGQSIEKSVNNIDSVIDKPFNFFTLDSINSLSIKFLIGSVINALIAAVIIYIVFLFILKNKNRKEKKYL
jgi:hypothetical protein